MSINAEVIYASILRGMSPELVADVSTMLGQISTSLGDPRNTFALQQHPLGFMCIKLTLDTSRTLRIHIWDASLQYQQDPNWPIHDHIFSFKSVVLLGRVQNKFYELVKPNSRRQYGIYEVDYSDQKSTLLNADQSVSVRPISSTLYDRGQSYCINAGELHRTALRSDLAITALATRTPAHHPNIRPRVLGSEVSPKLSYDRGIIEKSKVESLLHKALRFLGENK